MRNINSTEKNTNSTVRNTNLTVRNSNSTIKNASNSTVKNSSKVTTTNSPVIKVRETPIEKLDKSKKDIKPMNDTIKPQNVIKSVKELTNPTSIQINNAINNMSKKVSATFNIADIKLPPGITITKVDPGSAQSRNTKIQVCNYIYSRLPLIQCHQV